MNPRSAFQRARSLYTVEYARVYREHDEILRDDPVVVRLGGLLRETCRGLARERLVVLDLGCGTGRYFGWLEGVEALVGVDAAPAMLAQARQRLVEHPDARTRVHLIEGDLLAVDFREAVFHLVYSIGVLAEHAPLTVWLIQRIHRWLRPGGKFLFTAVHPLSPSIRSSLARRVAGGVVPYTFGAARTWLTRRLCAGGLYADEAFLRESLARAGFQVEQIGRFSFGERWQCLCVARKAAEHRA